MTVAATNGPAMMITGAITTVETSSAIPSDFPPRMRTKIDITNVAINTGTANSQIRNPYHGMQATTYVASNSIHAFAAGNR